MHANSIIEKLTLKGYEKLKRESWGEFSYAEYLKKSTSREVDHRVRPIAQRRTDHRGSILTRYTVLCVRGEAERASPLTE